MSANSLLYKPMNITSKIPSAFIYGLLNVSCNTLNQFLIVRHKNSFCLINDNYYTNNRYIFCLDPAEIK